MTRRFHIADDFIPDAHKQIWVESKNYPEAVPPGYVAVIRQGDAGAWPALLRQSWLVEITPPSIDDPVRLPVVIDHDGFKLIVRNPTAIEDQANSVCVHGQARGGQETGVSLNAAEMRHVARALWQHANAVEAGERA